MRAIALPLTLIGVGLILYLLFFGASHALRLGLGLAAAFVGTIATAYFLVGTIRGTAPRSIIVVLFALSAAAAGFSVAHGIAGISGITSTKLGLVDGIVTGIAVARRMQHDAARPLHCSRADQPGRAGGGGAFATISPMAGKRMMWVLLYRPLPLPGWRASGKLDIDLEPICRLGFAPDGPAGLLVRHQPKKGAKPRPVGRVAPPACS